MPPFTKTYARETDKNPPPPSSAQIDRNAWEVIAAFQKPEQPNALDKIIGLDLANSQAHVTQLRQAWQRQAYDALRGLGHTLKSSSAALAKELETCRTDHVE